MGERESVMADEQEVEVTAEEAPVEKPTVVAGRQRLETKEIRGQVITHTIVKPIPE
ncbi:hypothetical protein [Streptomyces sp. NPDC001903]|uniref:hypothetical protein n=1 Tax=Streptomyces sp. NPDC001903 TaxID=3364622 RepID=UPI0036B88FEF